MSKLIDLTGQRFGKLTVLRRVDNDKHGQTMWECQCDCGNIIVAGRCNLRSGDTTSCGCSRIGNGLIDLTGQRFGKLTVLQRDTSKPIGHDCATYWLCKCDCGNECSVPAAHLRKGQTKSCGCMRAIVSSKLHFMHGMSHTRIHNIWCDMNKRCNNSNASHYEYYGGRGIKVCDRWKSFENFYDDMIGTYSDGLTIDRINVDGNYEPSNCRWITMEDQARNKRTNIMITIDGETMCLAEWCRKFNLEYKTIRYRISNLKWTPEEALKTPIGGRRRVG